MENLKLINGDCIAEMQDMEDNSVDFTLTDIPYCIPNTIKDAVGFRKLEKGNANIMHFDLIDFLKQVYRITKNNICIFCGKEQFSDIYGFFVSEGGGYNKTDYLAKVKP